MCQWQALGGILTRVGSFPVSFIFFYVSMEVPPSMSHLMPFPPRPTEQRGLGPTKSALSTVSRKTQKQKFHEIKKTIFEMTCSFGIWIKNI